MLHVSRSGPVSRKLWTIIGGFKWILILGKARINSRRRAKCVGCILSTNELTRILWYYIYLGFNLGIRVLAYVPTVLHNVLFSVCTGLVYILVYMVVIALERDLGLVEPVSVKSKIQAQLNSYFEARSLPRSHFTPGSADLDSLVNSKMFKEQSYKLAWIKKRLQSYVVDVCKHRILYIFYTAWEMDGKKLPLYSLRAILRSSAVLKVFCYFLVWSVN